MLGYKKVKKVPRILNIKKDIVVNFIQSDDGYYLYVEAKIKGGFATSDEAQLFVDKLKKYFFAYTIDLYYADFAADVPEAFEPMKQIKAVVYNGVLASSKPTGIHPYALYTLDLTAMLRGSALDSISFIPASFGIGNDLSTYNCYLTVQIPISF